MNNTIFLFNRLPFCALFLALYSLFPALAQAQYKFTLHGMAGSTAFGYTNGQSLTFEFTLASTWPGPTTEYMVNGKHPFFQRWSGADLFSSVTGTGLTGSLATGMIGKLEVMDNAPAVDRFGVAVGFEVNTGLLLPNGASVTSVRFDEISWTDLVIPTPPQQFDDPNTYFDLVTGGTFAFASNYGGSAFIAGPDNVSMPINFTSLTISSGSAIPEPASFTVLAGMVALGCGTIGRRRFRHAAGQ